MALVKFRYIRTLLSFISVFFFIATNLQAQELKRIPRLIQEAKSQKGVFPKVDVFENQVTKHSDVKSLKDQPIDGVVLTLKDMSAIDFKSAAYKHLEFRIPQENGAYIDLELIRNDKSFANTIVKNQDGEVLDMEIGVHYRGIIKGDNESLCAVSFLESGVSGFVSNGSSHKSFSRFTSDVNKAFFGLTSSGVHGFQCGTETNSSIATNATNHSVGSGDLKSLASKCVSVYVEVDYDIYQQFGGGVVEEIFSEFNSSFSILENQISDGSNILYMIISNLMVWDTAIGNPYYGCDLNSDSGCCNPTNPLHEVFKNQFNQSDGDIGHLITKRVEGGEANGFYGTNLNEWCNEKRVCVSGFKNTYGGGLGSAYRLKLITHEMGHLLGARHTHDCVWNIDGNRIDDCGNILLAENPPPSSCIDNSIVCQDIVSDISNNSVNCEDLKLSTGTIMSYCGIFNNNNDCTMTTSMNFHTLVIDTIRNVVFSLPCIDNSCEYESCYYATDSEPNNNTSIGAYNAFPECGTDALNLTYQACISPSSDVDWYRFTTTSEGLIKIKLRDIIIGNDFKLELHYKNTDAQEGTELEEILPSQNYGSVDVGNWISYYNPDENTRQFFIRVSNNNTVGGGPYTVELDWKCNPNSNLNTGSSNALKSNDETVNITANPAALCNVGNVQLQVQSIHDNFVYLDVTNNYNVLCAGCSSSTTIQNAYPGMTIMAVAAGLDGCSILYGTVTIGQSTDPTANAGPNHTINIGQGVNLSGSGGSTYSWSPTESLSNPNIWNPYATPTITTTYTLTTTNIDGCLDTDQVTVTVSDGGGSPSVSNDNPCSANNLYVGTSCNYITGTNLGATASTAPTPSGCSSSSSSGSSNGDYSGGDVWYSATVPSSGEIYFQSQIQSSVSDIVFIAYSGNSCSSLSQIVCNDDQVPNSNYMPFLHLTNRTPGETIWLRVYDFGNDDFGDFGVCAFAPNSGGGVTGADLIVDNVSISDSNPDAGDQVTLSYRVRNIGNLNITSTFFQTGYLSSDLVHDSSDEPISNAGDFTSSLSAGSTKSITKTITIPNVADGGYYIIIDPDHFNTIPQSNYNNDLGYIPIQIGDVVADGPNLEVRDINITPSTGLAPGQEIEVEVEIKNQGNDDAGDFKTLVVFDINDNGSYDAGIDYPLVTISFPRLDEGDTDTRTRDEYLPTNIPSTGNYDIIVITDINNEINETDETDNQDSNSVQISTTTPAGPDLVPLYVNIEDLSDNIISPSNLCVNETYIINYGVNNIGSLDVSGGFSVYHKVYVSEDQILDGTDWFWDLSWKHAGSHDVNDPIYISDDKLFDGFAPGQHYIILQVDEREDIAELNEVNNIITVPIFINNCNNTPLPDVTGEFVSYHPYESSLGDDITTNLRIWNQGNAPVSNLRVELFVSDDQVFHGDGSGIEDPRLVYAYTTINDTIYPGDTINLSMTGYSSGLTSTGLSYLYMSLDENRDIAESDKANNTAHVPIYINSVDCYYNFEPGHLENDTISHSYYYGYLFHVRSEEDCFYVADGVENWIYNPVNYNESGLSPIYCSVAENPYPYPRNGHITVGDEVYVFTQLGAPCEVLHDSVKVVVDSSLTIVNHIGCDGIGSISPVLSGGYPPFEYEWQSLGDLTLETTTPIAQSGIYILSVTDSGGCQTTHSFNVEQTGLENSQEVLNTIQPFNDEIIIGTQVMLSWGGINSTDVSYSVLVSESPLFYTVDYQQDNVIEESLLLESLSPNTTYFWKVIVSDECGNTVESEVAQFVTAECITYFSYDTPVFIDSISPNTIISTISVSEDRNIVDLNVIDILGEHTWIQDLTVSLESPSGSSTTLWSRQCNDNDDFYISFNDESDNTDLPCPMTDGLTYVPEESLTIFDNESAAGEWILTVFDEVGLDGGELNSWSLEICYRPAEIVPNCTYSDSLALIAINNALNIGWPTDTPISTWEGIGMNDGVCVDSLNLSGMNISGQIPPEIADLSDLRYLNISQTALSGSIPPVIAELSNLESLWLFQTNLEGEIPEELGYMPNLIRLGLGNNELSGLLPGSLGNLPLVFFSVKSNELSGCYDENLLNLCQFENKFVSDGNNFDAPFQDFCNNEAGKCTNIQFDVKAMLEGPYDPTQSKMTTILNTERGLLPGQTPSSELAAPTPAGQPYNLPPWNYTGREGVNFNDTDYQPTVVDWVLVSLRTGVDKASEVARVAALLHEDGCIETLENHPLATSYQGPFYIVIEHRNHMGIMSPTPVAVVNGVLQHDFTAQDSYTALGVGAGQKAIFGMYQMFAGDYDQVSDAFSYDITGGDKIIWEESNGQFDIYIPADFNLDGDVNGADKIPWEVNNGTSSRVPK